MDGPLIVISRYRVKEGRREELVRWDEKVTEIVETNEPRVIAFHQFLNDDGTEMTSIQVHPDSASMDFHMQVLRDNWDDSFSDYALMLEVIGVEYYGTPSQSALDMDLQSGIAVGLYPRHLAGFTRPARDGGTAASS